MRHNLNIIGKVTKQAIAIGLVVIITGCSTGFKIPAKSEYSINREYIEDYKYELPNLTRLISSSQQEIEKGLLHSSTFNGSSFANPKEDLVIITVFKEANEPEKLLIEFPHPEAIAKKYEATRIIAPDAEYIAEDYLANPEDFEKIYH